MIMIDKAKLVEELVLFNGEHHETADTFEEEIGFLRGFNAVLEIIKAQPTIQPQGIDKDRLIELLNTDLSGCDGDFAEEMAEIIIANMQQPTTDVPDTNDGKMPRSYKDRVEHAIKVLEFCKQRHIDIATQLPHTVDIEVGKISCYAMALKVVRTLLPQPYKESE